MPATGVSFVRPEVVGLLQVWFMIRDCIEGEAAIKGEFGINASFIRSNNRKRLKAEDYLPRPNPTDASAENKERYKAYVKRAVFYNFTKRTLDGLTGQIFLRPPVSKLPKELDALVKNADGEGMNLEQVGKRICQSSLAHGRAGLLTDFPSVNSALTPADIAAGNIRPYIKHYYPWQIINWATVEKGANQVLALVVLEEHVMEAIDDFAFAFVVRYRVLRLDPQTGDYTVELWAPYGEGQRRDYKIDDTFVPRDAAGQTFKEIPFIFCGAEANNHWADVPPMQDLASLNVAHYRNSADYEEACFLTGQPTPVFTGLTQEWVENILKGTVQLGSRGSVSLPVGADAKLLQASPNQMPLEAMRQKEQQALSLGAKLVQASKKTRTATEVDVDKTSETSTLHNVSKNASAALEQALRWACRFAGVSDADTESLTYQLNSEFDLTRLGAEDLLTVMKIWQSGGVCFPEMRAVLKIAGYASMDDKEALAQIQAEQAAALPVAPIADPFQAATPAAPENQPGAGAGAGKGTPGHISLGATA